MSSGNVTSAIGMWETCATYESGFPAFVIGQQGDITINIAFASGRNPDQHAGCGGFVPSNGSGGVVTGGTITIYEQPGAAAAFNSCSSTYVETIAHELGHVLGLSESGCSGYIMTGNTGSPGRAVYGAECGAAALRWTTPAELGGGSGGGTDNPNTNCPLILDLNGDGIQTVSILDGVRFFDPDRDGVSNVGGWTRADTEEAFVWTDVNRDEAVNFGELLGTAFILPDGTAARNGFQVLAYYDAPELGGNADGFMTREDRFFHKLRLWIDRDHNGISTPDETMALPASNVVSITTAFEHVHTPDGNGNTIMLRGTYTTRHGQELTDRLAEDIGFRVIRK